MDKKRTVFEYSAGGIVFKRSLRPNGLKKERSQIYILVVYRKKQNDWDFPKGKIEQGETAMEAALREVEEETGMVAKIIEKVGKTNYFYFWDAERRLKTVTWFLMEYQSETKMTALDEVDKIEWLPVEEVEKKLTYKDTIKVWEKAKEKLMADISHSPQANT